MKSERRHQLETNVLADRVGHSIETAKPYFIWVLGAIFGLAILGMVYGWWQSRAIANAAVAWTEFFFSEGKQQALAPIYKEFPNSTAAMWARISEADLMLANGLNDVYTDREKANELFKKAQSSYESVLSEARDSMLRERALFGLAQAYESLGNADEAINRYREILKMGSTVEPALVEEVTRRVAVLSSDSGKEFFAMFKDFRPSPASPLGVPDDLRGLPGNPDMQFPGLEELLKQTMPSSNLSPSNAPPAGTIELNPPTGDLPTAVPSTPPSGTFTPPPAAPAVNPTDASSIAIPPSPATNSDPAVPPPSDNPANP